MKVLSMVVGIVLIIAGIVGFAYQGFSYHTQEKVAQFGNIEVTAETQKTVNFPPLLNGLSIAVGLILVVASQLNNGRKS